MYTQLISVCLEYVETPYIVDRVGSTLWSHGVMAYAKTMMGGRVRKKKTRRKAPEQHKEKWGYMKKGMRMRMRERKKERKKERERERERDCLN